MHALWQRSPRAVLGWAILLQQGELARPRAGARAVESIERNAHALDGVPHFDSAQSRAVPMVLFSLPIRMRRRESAARAVRGGAQHVRAARRHAPAGLRPWTWQAPRSQRKATGNAGVADSATRTIILSPTRRVWLERRPAHAGNVTSPMSE
jgi:hypothetical protein